MTRSPARTRHLIFMAHLWVLAPFLFVWVNEPDVRRGLPEGAFEQLILFIALVCLYLGGRSWLAWMNPPWLKWEFVFPPIDAAIVSALVWFGSRDPLSNVTLLYFLPLAEAAGTLSVLWAAAVAGWSLLTCAIATNGFETDDPYTTVFRYFFLLLMGSLFASLAFASARVREQLAIARDRNRIAMEMHDGVQGHLMTIASRLELAQRLFGSYPMEAKHIAEETRDTARLAADELRFLVHRLRAPALREGFVPALRQFFALQTERHGLQLKFQVEGDVAELDAEIENGLFRVAQEALNNVIRHAEATSVEIAIQFAKSDVHMTIVDDGKGFDPTAPEREQGYHAGLEGIESRASGLGGTATITSGEGQGCRLTVHIPLTSGARIAHV